MPCKIAFPAFELIKYNRIAGFRKFNFIGIAIGAKRGHIPQFGQVWSMGMAPAIGPKFSFWTSQAMPSDSSIPFKSQQ
jgi:hypothetical protein